MKQTAMQELFDNYGHLFMSSLGMVKDIFIAKEKEQIHEAYATAQIDAINIIKNEMPSLKLPKTDLEISKVLEYQQPSADAIKYYSQTYKNE